MSEFIVNKCHEKRYKTCSYKCGGIYKTKPDITNICIQCKISFISKRAPKCPQSFCSRSCSSKAKSKKIERKCVACEKIFHIIPSILTKSGGGTYCSQNCRLHHWNEKSLNAQMPGSYRENAWKVFDKKCYDCNLADERLLVIHHIDGNRKNGLISNLIPVCHNCHCLRHIELSGNNCIPSYRGKD